MAELVEKAKAELATPSQVNWEEVARVAKGIYGKSLTDAEFQAFLMVARKLGLDPVSKEIVPQVRHSRDGGRSLTLIITRDGYLKAAMRDPGYKGLQSMVVKEGDHFEVSPSEGKVIHRFGAKRGKILGAWAIAYHRDRQPVVYWADFDEYYQANAKSSPVWRTYPSAMILKTAEIGALRRQFNLSGVVGAEEIPEGGQILIEGDDVLDAEVVQGAVEPAKVDRIPVKVDENDITKTKDFRKFRALLNDLGISKDRELILNLVTKIVNRKVESSKELTLDELKGINSVLEEATKDAEPVPAEERPIWVKEVLLPQFEEAK